MPVAQPTLGYPSRTAAVHGLRDIGIAPKDIALRVGFCASRNISALSQARMRRTVHFSRDVLDLLKPHADRRGVCTTYLARLIVATAVDEGLVDAILDDRETP